MKFFYQLKVVKTRKTHNCIVCDEEISIGFRALVESGFNESEGYVSNYFCTDKQNDCHLDYIDAMQPILDICEKIKDKEFYGEIIYEKWKKKY